jgi:peroxiredoxin-like protein
MLDAYAFETDLEWTGKRNGELKTHGLPPLEFSAPPEFQGEAGFWSPEHLLVASTAGCLMTTFLAIAELSQLPVDFFHLKASGKVEKIPGASYRFTEIRLVPEVGVLPEQIEKARRVMAKAEKNCFISNSLRAEVHVEPAFTPVKARAAS